MSWFQFYVKFSECLLWLQESVAPATGDAAAPTASATPAIAEGGKAAAAGGAKAVQEPSPLAGFLPILIIGVFFYFILLRPQQKEQKRRQAFLTNLKKNAKVVTTGGMIGTVVDISSDGRFVTLRLDDTTRVKFLRSAIQQELDDKVEAASAST